MFHCDLQISSKDLEQINTLFIYKTINLLRSVISHQLS